MVQVSGINEQEDMDFVEEELHVPPDLPQAIELIHSMKDNVDEVTRHVEDMLKKVRQGEISTSKGLSFLEVKYHMLLSYLINLTYIILRKCSGEKIEGEPAIERLVEIRTVLEKMRPIDQKLKYQIDKLVKTAVTGSIGKDDPLHFKANPANLVSKLQDEEGSSDDSSEEESPTKDEKKGVYVPPKLAAVHYDEDEKPGEKEQRLLERARKHALSSSVLRELREEYLDTPVEVTTGNEARASLLRRRQEKQEYEESYFTRLNVTKKDKHKARQMSTLGRLGDELTKFEDLGALQGAGPSTSSGKKRKLSNKQKGKGKKKGFKKRKF